MIRIRRISLRNKTHRVLLGVCAVLVAIASSLQLAGNAVHADQYDDQINALQQEIDQFNAQAGSLNKKVNTLKEELKGIDRQKSLLQKRIDLQQAKYDKLKKEIKETEEKITDNKEALGQVMADLYVDRTITPLEMLASSNNVAEYVDKNTYRTSMSDTLDRTIKEIKVLKAKLDKQKREISRTLADLNNSKKALVAKEEERSNLLAKTKGQQDSYERLAADRESQKLRVQQQQQAAIEAAIRAAGGGSGVVLPGTSGGYPWNSSNCYVDANAWSYGGIDGNGTDGMGYGCRQCVSYVAWRVYKETGYAPVNWGNAYDWAMYPSGAPRSSRAGFAINSTPAAGSAGVITSGGSPGHIVYVESVNWSAGSMVVSQYNYFNAGGPGWGNYSKMQVPIGTYQYYVHFER